jgi:hypothetical protein
MSVIGRFEAGIACCWQTEAENRGERTKNREKMGVVGRIGLNWLLDGAKAVLKELLGPMPCDERHSPQPKQTLQLWKQYDTQPSNINRTSASGAPWEKSKLRPLQQQDSRSRLRLRELRTQSCPPKYSEQRGFNAKPSNADLNSAGGVLEKMNFSPLEQQTLRSPLRLRELRTQSCPAKAGDKREILDVVLVNASVTVRTDITTAITALECLASRSQIQVENAASRQSARSAPRSPLRAQRLQMQVRCS